MNALITSPTGILTVLCGIAGIFFYLEKNKKWKIFNYFPPLLFIYCIPAILSNVPIGDNFYILSRSSGIYTMLKDFGPLSNIPIGESFNILPHSSGVYSMLKDIGLPFFLVILLIKVDVVSTVKIMGRGVFVMLMGAAGVVIGAPLSYLLVRNFLPPETWKAFGTLAGSWIGGTGNMAAVAGGLEVGKGEFGLAVLGDNAVYLVWLPILLASKALAKPFHRFIKIDHEKIKILEAVEAEPDEKNEPIAMRHFLYLFMIGFACIWIANALSPLMPVLKPVLTASTWKILLITTMGLALSWTPARKIPASHELAMAIVYLFVANMGAKADLSQLNASAGWFILACYVWIAIHGAFCLLGAYIFKVDIHSTAIASAANIGGAASAPIVAAYHNEKLVPVSILMALVGYAIGNYGAFFAAWLCSLLSPG
ncbi:MAG: DUF819 family protein [Planctomycetes bacterium]|nr:DUF819 family protein [Planctomycetota bacterium]